MSITTGIIDPRDLSFESILEKLQSHAKSKPEGAVWKDWYASSDGQVIMEWVAGLATFRAYHEIARVRESQLDHAQLPSSVFNLAFGRGLLVPPASGGEILLDLTVPSVKSIEYGDLVATLDSYEVYSLESKTLHNQDTLHCLVGRINEFTEQVSGLKPFTAFRFQTPDQYLCTQLEEFTADEEVLPLLSDPDYLEGVGGRFLLRRVMPNESRIYLGNGQLGWYNSAIRQIKYRVFSYGADLVDRIYDKPQLVISGLLNSSQVLVQPALDPDKEEVRQIARFYPIDGRIVTDTDYAMVIRKNYGGLVTDVYSYNTDPDQHVTILKSDNFGTGEQEQEYLRRIKQLVDSKRTLGIPVIYRLLDRSEGVSYVVNLKVDKAHYTNKLVTDVNSYLSKKLWKFQKVRTAYSFESLANELSAKFKVKFLRVGEDLLTLEAEDFFKEFYATVST